MKMHCAQYNQIQVEQDNLLSVWCILSIFIYLFFIIIGH